MGPTFGGILTDYMCMSPRRETKRDGSAQAPETETTGKTVRPKTVKTWLQIRWVMVLPTRRVKIGECM
jgi:hypothetical protein